jgi:hypothetical protein
MTIGTTTQRVSFNCDGATKVFPVAIQGYAASDFTVILTAPASAGGAESTLVLNSDYSLTATGTLAPQAWTLTTLAAQAYAAGYTLQVFSNPVQNQQTQYVQGQAFPSLAVQTNMDRLTLMVQRLQDQVNRCIRAPDGDVSPAMLMPIAQNRLDGFLATDGLGNLSFSIPTTQTISLAILASFLNLGQTAAELAAGVTPSVVTYPQGDVRRYGAILDGATDCTSAMVQACAVGGAIFMPGNMALASSSLAALPNAGIAIKPGTAIYGIPGFACTITGITACNVFYTTDASDVYFVDFYCKGNGVGTSTTGYFWYMLCSNVAIKDASNLQFIRGGLENFAGYYWIYADNTAAINFAFRKFICDGSRFLSKTDNAQGPTTITVTASVFGFSGSDTVTSFSTCTDCVVRNCYADGTHIKSFVYFWSGNGRCKAYNNTLVGFGTGSEFSNDTGAYALAAYDHSHGTGLAPDEIEFTGNLIDSVRDCGIYAAGAVRIKIANNYVNGQTSTANGTIPKGGIAINGCQNVVSSDNTLYNCAFGVSVVQSPGGTFLAQIRDTVVEGMPNNGIGMVLSGSTGGNAQDIIVDGLKVQTSGTSTTGILVNVTSTVGINDLELRNFHINGAATGIVFFAPDSTVPALGNIYIGMGKIRGASGTCLNMAGCTSASQHIVIESLTFDDMQGNAAGLVISSVPGLTVRNILFVGLSGGSTYCWNAGGAQGRVDGVQYQGVAIANRYDSSASRLGVDTPTFSGNDNDFIQNLSPTELGSTSSKYISTGWLWDSVNAAWKQCRSLTGN